MNILDTIKKDIRGAAILSDWLGDDMRHVSQADADHRSLACLRGNNGEMCPHNKDPNWWEKNLSNPIAQAMRHQLEIKFAMKLQTPFDDKLGVCSQCGCATPLKIWCPISHIKNHSSTEMLEKLPTWCWMKEALL